MKPKNHELTTMNLQIFNAECLSLGCKLTVPSASPL